MTGKLDGKVIVISGGTQGLGEAIARQVVADGAAGVMIAGRSADRGAALAKELTDLGTPTSFIEADMADRAAPRKVIDAADKQFGVIHGVVNVAAATWRDNVWTATPDGFEEMIAVNVRAPMFMIQAAAEVMRREGVAGSCVSIGSTSGHGGQPFILSYCVSKGALETMTRNLAFALMRHKVRVNVVSPGWMDTESEDAVQRKFHGATDGWLERAEAEQPMGRLIKPQEVAKVVAFYLSDESGMLTGNIVDYDQSVLGAGDAPKPSLQETPQ
ncbi:MAG TPA: SDR family oxidoreductase [Ilumatobacteraceae bacterium]|jgi:NAD(P)-dependent dehydrogenase (short-subunit alcohol dehydrogenase family)